MPIEIINQQREIVNSLPLAEKIWEFPYSAQAVSLAVRSYLANQRQATSKTKNRGEVKGSTRKIYRQKGSGRARHGSRYAPQFRGGGIAFGPTGQKNYHCLINQKTKQKAFQSALVAKKNQITVVEEIKLSQPKTRKAQNWLNQLGLAKQKVLIILAQQEPEKEKLKRAFRNLSQVSLTDSRLVNTYWIITHPVLLFSQQAFREVEQRLISSKKSPSWLTSK